MDVFSAKNIHKYLAYYARFVHIEAPVDGFHSSIRARSEAEASLHFLILHNSNF